MKQAKLIGSVLLAVGGLITGMSMISKPKSMAPQLAGMVLLLASVGVLLVNLVQQHRKEAKTEKNKKAYRNSLIIVLSMVGLALLFALGFRNIVGNILASILLVGADVVLLMRL